MTFPNLWPVSSLEIICVEYIYALNIMTVERLLFEQDIQERFTELLKRRPFKEILLFEAWRHGSTSAEEKTFTMGPEHSIC